ncbi:MAG: hypothetical protein ACRDX8_02980 [Acidimicrobiales bacterium]
MNRSDTDSGDADVGQVEDHDGPHQPDAEGEVVGQHGEPEILAGNPLAGGFPELFVVGLPVVDPVIFGHVPSEPEPCCQLISAA